MTGAYEHVYLPISADLYYTIKGRPAVTAVNAVVSEVSTTGLKFIATENIPPNTIVELKICLEKNSEPLVVKARILWQRQVYSLFLNAQGSTGSLHNTAVVFIDFDKEQRKRYDIYIHRFSEKVAVNRAHIRLALILDAKFSKKDRSDGALFDCVIGDIGIEGVKLYVKERVEISQIIRLIFALPDGFGQLELTGKVVRKNEAKEQISALGVEFTEISLDDKEKILDFISSRLG